MLNRKYKTVLALLTVTYLSLPALESIAKDRADYEAAAAESFGAKEVDANSPFGLVRIRKRGHVRTMLFVQSNGLEVGETMLHTAQPHQLIVPYTQTMFSSLLLQPSQKRILIVGLGGGAMVHFIKHHLPNAKVDAIEINPVVVKMADKYFGMRTEGNVRVITGDGLEFIRKIKQPYDAIYMDAFLKPSNSTDGTGRPLNLQTLDFYRTVQSKLARNGVAAFNVNIHANVAEDIATLRQAFPQLYLFVPSDSEIIAIGNRSRTRQSPEGLRRSALAADRKYQKNFAFQNILETLIRE